jgi:hypothetical protein
VYGHERNRDQGSGDDLAHHNGDQCRRSGQHFRVFPDAGQRRSWENLAVPVGGFKTVELNVLGWIAVVGPGAVVGALLAWGVRLPVAPLVVCGAGSTFVIARVADEVRDRRRWLYLPVASAAEARDRLASGGIAVLDEDRADVDGRVVDFIAVRERDYIRAHDLVGLPRLSRRGQRRWKKALHAGMRLSGGR